MIELRIRAITSNVIEVGEKVLAVHGCSGSMHKAVLEFREVMLPMEDGTVYTNHWQEVPVVEAG